VQLYGVSRFCSYMVSAGCAEIWCRLCSNMVSVVQLYGVGCVAI